MTVWNKRVTRYNVAGGSVMKERAVSGVFVCATVRLSLRVVALRRTHNNRRRRRNSKEHRVSARSFRCARLIPPLFDERAMRYRDRFPDEQDSAFAPLEIVKQKALRALSRGFARELFERLYFCCSNTAIEARKSARDTTMVTDDGYCLIYHRFKRLKRIFEAADGSSEIRPLCSAHNELKRPDRKYLASSYMLCARVMFLLLSR